MKVALLCSDPVYAEGLACLLRHYGGHEVVCCAGHLGGAQCLSSLKPELLVATEEFDDRAHRFLIQKVKDSGMKAVLLFGEEDSGSSGETVFDLRVSRLGGVGALLEAVRGPSDTSHEAECVRHERGASKPAARNAFQFTPREREVSALVARGLSNKQIASIIGTGEQNVKMYVSRLMRLLGCANRVQLALLLQPGDVNIGPFPG
jgi:DNA-binding NarL/FixJ family response regulator